MLNGGRWAQTPPIFGRTHEPVITFAGPGLVNLDVGTLRRGARGAQGVVGLALGIGLGLSCEDGRTPAPRPTAGEPGPHAPTSATVVLPKLEAEPGDAPNERTRSEADAALDASSISDAARAIPDATLSSAADAAPRPRSPGKQGDCPDGMLFVEGEFCPGALQICMKHHIEYEHGRTNPTVSERCLVYKEPSKCISPKRKHMRFCIDRYEWPNKKGELPMVLVQWLEAKQLCESAGKRLCDDNEWRFACEGEEMLPYVYGFVRDPAKCFIDRPYVRREKPLKRYQLCLADPECLAELKRLDQRQPAGSFPDCISSFGAYDMNGSVNEWVNVPDKEPPNRSGLKGGWWGPVRSRCEPTVTFHKEEDWGYEAGFRCCKNAPD